MQKSFPIQVSPPWLSAFDYMVFGVDRILKIITSLDDISQREERILKDVLKALRVHDST